MHVNMNAAQHEFIDSINDALHAAEELRYAFTTQEYIQVMTQIIIECSTRIHTAITNFDPDLG